MIIYERWIVLNQYKKKKKLLMLRMTKKKYIGVRNI
nr:MAG TPA: hypothetical protein [Caudoviricetes sp.]